MKKGYTLIELLAVIALLAILLLLLVPRVIDIYVEAKKNTFKNEALSIVTSAETKYIAESIINNKPLECWEYKDDNNELKGYVEYKEGYSGKVVKAGDTIYINVTNGEYTIKGLTKRNASEEETKVIEGTEEEYSRDFTCSEEGALETEVKLESKTYNKMFVYINVPELEVIGEEDKERENITYQFSIDEEEWTEEQTSMYYFYKELEPETEYEIRGRVLVKNEVVGTSDILTVTTDKILGPTITLNSLTKTYNSVTLTAESEHTQPDLITEKYEFSKDAGITWEPIQTSNTYTYENLTSNTEYTFKVRGTNNKGVTGESEGIKVTTEAITPPVITLTSPTKTYNSVSLTATASDNQTGIKANTYQFSKDNGVTWSALQSTNTYTFTGLISGTSYNFKARVQNNGGLVGDSSTLAITTDVLLAPTISLTSPTKTYNSVSLTATGSDTQTGIKSGTYQFSKDNGVTWTALQSSNTYTFTGLSSGTTYNFKARVQNNGGAVGTTSTLSVTTEARFTVVSYTGTWSGVYEDATYKYVKFLTSGTATFNASGTVDVFLVGGGGGGGSGVLDGGGGGGGGYTATYRNIAVNQPIFVAIGSGGSTNIVGNGLAGGTTTFGSLYASGGSGGKSSENRGSGGAGGSGGGSGGNAVYGGNGGSNGSDGGNPSDGGSGGGLVVSGPVGIGQGTTTRAFGEPTGELYAGGGGGGATGSRVLGGTYGGVGGSGGGGYGPGSNTSSSYAGTPNTGGGGGAAYGGNGGSGIVIIRWLK